MAKGKTNDPLNLVVDISLITEPEVLALVEQGHNIKFRVIEEDGYIGPRFWRMGKELIKYLPMAIKAIRKEKRESGTDRKEGKPKKAVRRAKKGAGGASAGSPSGSVSEGGGGDQVVSDGATEQSGN